MIPIFGVIGEDITVAALRAGLGEARSAQAKYVVLAIDSPGGLIGEMAGMVDLLNDAKDVEVIAYVKSAYSAAAVVAMSCRQVYMKPDATLGATVPFKMTDNGPADVDAKFRSVIEAKMRAANQHGGHADLLIRGMSETDLEIFLAQEDGKPVLRTAGPGKLIKAKGQILTLTADEAAECGLAKVSPEMADLGNQICGGPWHEVNKKAWNATMNAVALQHQKQKAAIQDLQKAVARRRAFNSMKPELQQMEARMAELAAKAVACNKAIQDLNTRYKQELKQIDDDYKQAVDQTGSTAARAQALELAKKRAADARHSLDANASKLQADRDAAAVELKLLEEKQKRMLATVSGD